MTTLLSRTLFVLAAALVLVAAAQAQIPYASNARIEAAAAIAKDSLNDPNAVLIRILSPGRSVIGDGQALTLTDGRSIHWIYLFYSSREDKSALVMQFQPFNGFFVGAGVVVDTVAAADSLVLNTALTYTDSPKMAEAIRANAEYTAFLTAHPATEVDVAMLSRLPNVPFGELPGGFPVAEPMWLVTLSDRQDSTAVLVCVVSASNGMTLCRDVSEPVGGADASFQRGDLGLAVTPNPASGDARITISAPEGRSLAGASVGLFDVAGALVVDLTERFADGSPSVRIDVSEIPSGTYYCRAVGPQVNGVIGVIVR